jgi:hypothetical protein
VLNVVNVECQNMPVLLSVIVLNVVMVSDVMLNVVAPLKVKQFSGIWAYSQTSDCPKKIARKSTLAYFVLPAGSY